MPTLHGGLLTTSRSSTAGATANALSYLMSFEMAYDCCCVLTVSLGDDEDMGAGEFCAYVVGVCWVGLVL